MAKKLINSHYSFTASTKQVVIPEYVKQEDILLITNLTRGVIAYNFADPAKGASSVTFNEDTDQTTITLDYAVPSAANTDKLQIFIDQPEQKMDVSDALLDPVHKIRVSEPENLIDTDFEYGLQSTKWETLEMMNNVPSFYINDGDTIIPDVYRVVSNAGSRIITVQTSSQHGLPVGVPIDVQGLSSRTAEGKFLIRFVDDYSFSYEAAASQTTTGDISGPYTQIAPGQFYSGSQISLDVAAGITSNEATTSTLTLTTPNEHGFVAGCKFYLVNTIATKILRITATSTSNAADGRPYVDPADTLTTAITLDMTQTETKSLVPMHHIKFDASAVDILNDTITWTEHSLKTNDCLIYVPSSGDAAIGGLSRFRIYYVIYVDENTIKLASSYNGAAINLTSVGGYSYGRALLGVAYELTYAQRSTDRYTYFRTRAYENGGVGSGWDLSAAQIPAGGLGLGGASFYQIAVFYNNAGLNFTGASTAEPDGLVRYPRGFTSADSSSMVTPETTTTPGVYNFIEDSYYWNYTYNQGGYSSYAGNIQSNRQVRTYTGYSDSSAYNLVDGTQFWIPMKFDDEGDSFYAENHGLTTGANISMTLVSGSDIYEQYSTTSRRNLGGTGTYQVEVLSENRFRLVKSGVSVRIVYATGTYTWQATYENPAKDSFYVDGHGLITGQPLTFSASGIPSTLTGAVKTDINAGTHSSFHNVIEDYFTNGQGATDLNTVPLVLASQANINSGILSTSFGNRNLQLYRIYVYARQNAYGTYYYPSGFVTEMQTEDGWHMTEFSTDEYHRNMNFRVRMSEVQAGATVPFVLITGVGDFVSMAAYGANTNLYQQMTWYPAYTTWSGTDNLTSTFYEDNDNTTNTGNHSWYWSSQVHNVLRSSGNRAVTLQFKLRLTTGSYNSYGMNGTSVSSTSSNYTYTYFNSYVFQDDLHFSLYFNRATDVSQAQLLTISTNLLNHLNTAWAYQALSNNLTVYANVKSAQRFALQDAYGKPYRITSSGTSPYTFTTTSLRGAIDGAYEASSAGTKDLQFQSNAEVKPTDYTFAAGSVSSSGIVTNQRHHYLTGSKVTYNNGGNTTLAGLTNNGTYYVVVIDDFNIQLATSYQNAISETFVTLTAGTGTHNLYSEQLSGMVYIPGTLTTDTESTNIVGTDTLFRRYFKPGDKIFIKTGAYSFFERTIVAIGDDENMQIDQIIPVFTETAEHFTTTQVYARPDGYAVHRPFDGGVEIAAGTSPYSQVTRQTRKYFRYQSGKGIQTSLAINFSPPTIIETLTGNGSTTATVRTKYPHRLSTGMTVTVEGASANQYNGSKTITVLDDFRFSYTMSSRPNTTIPSGICKYVVNTYSGAAIRSGMFDFQNGFFYEYDGAELYAVRRSSTTQLSGTVTATKNSGLLTGINTNFAGQLTEGDYVVVRGMTYKVVAIKSRTSMVVQPEYRGVSASGIIITKTEDLRVPQDQWNIDKCDGTGPEGFHLNIHKIQMAYMDYSWYGAGKIRFGFKDRRGHVRYVHEFLHNNRLDEAYMRSGNLPAKYEAINGSNPSYAPTLFHWGTSVIMDGRFDEDEAYLFTATSNQLSFTGGSTATATTNGASSLVFIKKNKTQNTYYIKLPFPSSASNILSVGTVLDNAALEEFSGQSIVYNDYSGSTFNVYLLVGDFNNWQPPNVPTVPAATTFTIGGTETVSLTTSKIPLVSLRLAPSVDSNLQGALGRRDIINRMQLKLQEVSLILTHDCDVSLILNGSLSNVNFSSVNQPSLSQLISHQYGEVITGGSELFSFRASGGVPDNNGRYSTNATTLSLAAVIDLGNSILGGDGIFPNGPDVITIAVKVVDTSQVAATAPFQASGRITWAESQA